MNGSTEYSAVLMLVNTFIPMHVKNGNRTFIKPDLVIDLQVTQIAAQKFAAEHRISYNSTVFTSQNPIMSVFKEGSLWYPADYNTTSISVLDKWESVNLGHEDLKVALGRALIIATARKLDFVASLGIFIEMSSAKAFFANCVEKRVNAA